MYEWSSLYNNGFWDDSSLRPRTWDLKKYKIGVSIVMTNWMIFR